MSNPFVGEIRIFGFNFAPRGWAMCNGQLLLIAQNTALFSLLGTFYGGDGRTTFALPNLQGSVPLHQGTGAGLTGRSIGETGGSELVTLMLVQLPAHSHVPQAVSSRGTAASPTNATWAAAGRGRPVAYTPDVPATPMNRAIVGPIGGDQPHNNLPPYLVLNFCIALQGIFPARS
ncbi:MAG: tail fiber protein [Herpetosiphon sp.]